MVADNNVVLVSASISRRSVLLRATIANSYTRRFGRIMCRLSKANVQGKSLSVFRVASSQGAGTITAQVIISFVKFADWVAQDNVGWGALRFKNCRNRDVFLTRTNDKQEF